MGYISIERYTGRFFHDILQGTPCIKPAGLDLPSSAQSAGFIILMRKDFKMSIPKGFKHSEESKRKMKESFKGHFVSEETKQKISKALKGNKNGYGFRHTEKTKNKLSMTRKGKGNPMWNGGKSVNFHGYIIIYKPDHLYCCPKGYVLEHRLIMEEVIGRYLTEKEVVHHINENRTDNRPENLKLFKGIGDHTRFHTQSKKGKDNVYI